MRCISLEQSPPKNAFSVSEISSEEQVDERALLKQIRLQQNIFTQPVKIKFLMLQLSKKNEFKKNQKLFFQEKKCRCQSSCYNSLDSGGSFLLNPSETSVKLIGRLADIYSAQITSVVSKNVLSDLPLLFSTVLRFDEKSLSQILFDDTENLIKGSFS